MVVSFARHSFRLSEENVALALESAIGGYCSQLKVSCLRDQVFSFHVSCKEFGFSSCISVASFALSLSVISISGIMAALIGKRSLGFGNQNATKSGR